MNSNSGGIAKQRIKQMQGVMEKLTILYGFRLYVFGDPNSLVPETELRLPLRFTTSDRKPEYSYVIRSVA